MAAATWNTVAPGFIGHQAIDDNSDTQQHELGTCIEAKNEDYNTGKFIYLKGVASTEVGSLVFYNPDDYSTALAQRGSKGFLAVAMAATVADEYGWYQIKGKGSVAALSGFVDNADCYLSNTAGSVDDDPEAGEYIRGMIGASAVSDDLADVELDEPRVLDEASNQVVDIGDNATYTVLAANSGKIHTIPDLTADLVISLPTAAAGLRYVFIYSGVAADSQDWQIDTGSDTNFFLGGLLQVDDAPAADSVAPDGDSNSKVNILTPEPGTRVEAICDGTNWILDGTVVSVNAPTYADQG